MVGQLDLPAEDRKSFALRLHEEALRLRNVAGRSLYELAMRLYVIKTEELWRDIDPELRSFDEYLEQYGFYDWARGKSYALLGQVRDLIPLGARVEDLAEAGWSKVEVVRPAVKQGLVTLEEALADAKALGRKDLIRKYKEITGKVDDLRSCHDCIYLRRGDKARGDVLVARIAGGGEIELDVDWRYCAVTKRVWIEGPTPSEAREVARQCSEFTPDGGVADRGAAQDLQEASVTGTFSGG